MISYTDDLSFATPDLSGTIKHASVLRERLGVPEDLFRQAGVFLDPTVPDFQKREAFEGIANTLMDIYGIWSGSELFLPKLRNQMTVTVRLDWMRKQLEGYGMKVDKGAWDMVMSSQESPARRARVML